MKPSPKWVWLTDLHMDFWDESKVQVFYEEVRAYKPEALLVSGDVADGRWLIKSLDALASTFSCPIYFLVGNHGYYHTSIPEQDAAVARLCGGHPNLIRLGTGPTIPLTPTVGLLGHDCWADGRAGNACRSRLSILDFELIQDLKPLRTEALFRKLIDNCKI